MAGFADVLAAVELDGCLCSATDCPADPVAVRVAEVSGRAMGIVWLCWRHARETHAAGVDIHLIKRDCRSGDTTRCGAAATHLAVVADPRGEVAVMGVCRRHIIAGAD
jgi:hypothetical protein